MILSPSRSAAAPVVMTLVPSVTFADFIVTKVEADAKDEVAVIHIDYYEAASDKPRSLKENALKENGQWKIQWEDPDDAADENTLVPVAPADAQPAVPKAGGVKVAPPK